MSRLYVRRQPLITLQSTASFTGTSSGTITEITTSSGGNCDGALYLDIYVWSSGTNGGSSYVEIYMAVAPDDTIPYEEGILFSTVNIPYYAATMFAGTVYNLQYKNKFWLWTQSSPTVTAGLFGSAVYLSDT